MTTAQILNKINGAIINPLIMLVFAIALLIFFYGIFQFVISAQADTTRDDLVRTYRDVHHVQRLRTHPLGAYNLWS